MESQIEYIPNNWFSKTVMDKENPNHDAHDLCLNGYLFKRQRVNKKSINWLCKVKGCSSSVTLNGDKVERFTEHNFDVFHQKFTEIEQTKAKFKTSLKIRCESEPNLSAGQIFISEQENMAKTSGLSYEDLATALPSYAAIKPTLQKRKKKGCL
jgi:hypothetical protein